MKHVHTVTLPDHETLAQLGPVPDGIRTAVWDLKSMPEGADLSEIQGVILPYLNAGEVLDSLKKVPNLKFVQAQSTGFDGIREAAGPNAAVANASGVHAAATAELAIGLLIAKLRGIDVAARDQLARKWQPDRRLSLADRKVLLVGVGGIGQAITSRLEPFEVELTRVGSSARDDAFGHIHGVDELHDLVPHHDVLVVATPLTSGTKHLINDRVLSALPDGALVVNVGRGAVIDTDALTSEVLSGRLYCALDVVDPEPLPNTHRLWGARNALITPHVGGNASAFEPRIRALLIRQINALALGRVPENLVQVGQFR
ncbi:2-hydroxyacid dehydrogenase [Arthrobacter sp. EH-1B-1]|uniref:2-hydroxyacid dehydrogenase n=1 Tax=Arthrobacter vasquezii TaxID=2977629 RepID=A0ABT6CQ82_9MICC|nr:2-hydroxyacid dehydrogenase [Arthrobacter vasquezii]MDF9276295.1 2-hydroxyacid dehydrogenase [Arthrobacter vasquezii]